MNFKELGLNEQMIDSISYMGYKNATPIQELAIPEILKGNDLIACAQTGTGKTAAFVLPIINQLTSNKHNGTSTLIITPTRELAIQIEQQIQGFTYFTDVQSISVYGGTDGSDWEIQKKALTSGADIIVATPGKLISHLNMGYVKFDQIKYLILDEADRMLDIGFYDDILKIITFLPKNRQTLMFSATMPDKIRQLAKKILSNPTHLSTEISKPADGVLQAAYLAHNAQKIPLIKSLIDNKPNLKSILIFSSTKLKVNEIVRGLRTKEFLTEGISSNLEQDAREAVLLRFRSKKTKTLVATDVLSRGIDIKAIDLVINFDVPNDAEDYVHRVGRTARADETGVALTLVNEEDMYKFKRIEVFLGEEIMKIPMPARLGEAPIWNPNAPRPEGRFGNKGKTGRKNFRGRNKKK